MLRTKKTSGLEKIKKARKSKNSKKRMTTKAKSTTKTKRRVRGLIKRILLYSFGFALIVVLGYGVYLAKYYNLFPQRAYRGEDFGITTLQSEVDYDQDGVDDYLDIMLGARAYVETKPKYQSAYHAGGYPPLGIGVCTDVVWYALDAAGYSLKDLVDRDILDHLASYPRVGSHPDANIDFRRVQNLMVYFDRHALVLSTSLEDFSSWQAGDIVVYKEHIGIVSELRNKKGVPYLIHHGGQPNYEEDALQRHEIVRHYRWLLEK